MLPAQNRLRQRQDFARVYAEGDRYHGQYLRICIFDTDCSSTPSQIGIVVSKKVSKKAVYRNRIRRQLCAIFREILSQLKQGLQIVVTVSTQQESRSYGQMCQDLTKLLTRAQVLHGN